MFKNRQIGRYAASCLLLVLLCSLGLPPTHAKRLQLNRSAQALAEARKTLDEAIAHEKAHPDKAAALAVQAALETYSRLAARRVAELHEALRRLDRKRARLFPPDAQGEGGLDVEAAAPRMPDRMARIYAALSDELAALSKTLVSERFDVVSEEEPNDTPAEATPLDVPVQPVAIGSGMIFGAGDVDYYSIQVPADSLVWAYVDPGSIPMGTSGDTLITILAPDGSTELEMDDDDGTGNECGPTTFTLAASAIAGLQAPAAGTYFVRVQGANSGDTIDSYQLYVSVTPASGVVPEVENNDSPPGANPIISPPAGLGVVSGSLSSPTDVDLFSFPISSGTPLYVSLDADPERDGGADLAVDLLTPDGQTVLFTADSSQAAVANAEAFCFTFRQSDTYFIRVRHASQSQMERGAEATYRLLAAEALVEGECPPTIIHGTLGSGSPDYPSQSGLQMARLRRNGLTSTCQSPRPCPGVFDPTGLRAYDTYTFTNKEPREVCVNVTYATLFHPDSGSWIVTYLGSYDPNDLCANYLANTGLSALGTTTIEFSFLLGPGQSVVFVVQEVTPGTAEGFDYTLSVSGLDCPPAEPAFDVCMRDDTTGATFQAVVGDRTSPDYGYWEYRSGTTVLCGRADTINYVPGRSLLLRDNDRTNNSGCLPATMYAQFDFGRRTALVQITPVGGRTITLRDRNLQDSSCGP